MASQLDPQVKTLLDAIDAAGSTAAVFNVLRRTLDSFTLSQL